MSEIEDGIPEQGDGRDDPFNPFAPVVEPAKDCVFSVAAVFGGAADRLDDLAAVSDPAPSKTVHRATVTTPSGAPTALPTVGVTAAGSERPDLPLGHTFWSDGIGLGICTQAVTHLGALCGQPESAHRPKEKP